VQRKFKYESSPLSTLWTAEHDSHGIVTVFWVLFPTGSSIYSHCWQLLLQWSCILWWILLHTEKMQHSRQNQCITWVNWMCPFWCDRKQQNINFNSVHPNLVQNSDSSVKITIILGNITITDIYNIIHSNPLASTFDLVHVYPCNDSLLTSCSRASLTDLTLSFWEHKNKTLFCQQCFKAFIYSRNLSLHFTQKMCWQAQWTTGKCFQPNF
jgi:hypothetical protein